MSVVAPGLQRCSRDNPQSPEKVGGKLTVKYSCFEPRGGVLQGMKAWMASVRVYHFSI